MTKTFAPIQRSATTALSRRALLGGGAVAAAAVTGVLAGCTTQADSDNVPVSQRVPLPTHVPWAGVAPDLPGENGSADAFISYPASPPSSVSEVPGDGEPVTAMCATYMSARPPVPGNQAGSSRFVVMGSVASLA